MQLETAIARRDDLRHHTTNLRKILTAVIDHARKDVREISDPKAQALFETTAEVLIGLRKAFEDFEQGSEKPWKNSPQDRRGPQRSII